MFTDKGKNLVARKVGGLTDACIDYISVGIGGRPIPSTILNVPDNSHQSSMMTNMVHEVARVPVLSSLPTTNGIVKCIAELPNDLNCEFTEVGIWTHESNVASAHPSTQIISAFDDTENWLYEGTEDLPIIINTSDTSDFYYPDVQCGDYPADPDDPDVPTLAMYSPYDDILWSMNPERKVRKEGFRLSTEGIIFRGDSSTLGSSLPYSTPASGSINLSVNGLPFDLAGPDDELRLSYFVSPVDDDTIPDSVRIAVHFRTSDDKYAKWHIMQNNPQVTTNMTTTTDSNVVTFDSTPTYLRDGDMLWKDTLMRYPAQFHYTGAQSGILSMNCGISGTSTAAINQILFSNSDKTVNNTYFTQRTKLDANDSTTDRNKITYDSGFLWANVAEIIVYVTVSQTDPSNYYVGLDSLSFVNTDPANPGYGMVAYDIAKNYETRGIITRVGSPTSVIFEVQIV